MIGKLRDRILLQQRIRITVSGAGGLTSWEDVADIWGEAKPLSSSKTLQDNQVTLRNGYIFLIRYRIDFTPDVEMRVVYDGRFYTINGVEPLNDRKGYWNVTALTNDFPVS